MRIKQETRLERMSLSPEQLEQLRRQYRDAMDGRIHSSAIVRKGWQIRDDNGEIRLLTDEELDLIREPNKRLRLVQPPTHAAPLLDEYAVARMTGMSVATVRRWRLDNQGPRFIKVSKSAVRYRPEDVKEYLESRETGGGE